MDPVAQENFLLAEKLRNEDPEQFFTLVRMHLSFVLDLNADESDGNAEKKFKALKWNLPFTKKQRVIAKNNTSDSLVLSLDFIAQMHPVIKFLSKEENISQEGIFRRSGRITRQQELKSLLHQGANLNFDEGQFSVHECATVLKNVLSELPESILTDAHYPAYCQIADLGNGKTPADNEKLLRSIQLLILLLPNENRNFFQEIIELLHLAVKHEDKNRMSAENLATLFTPHLLCPRKLSPEALHTNSQIMSRVVAFMIQKGSELFEIPPTVATDVRAYWNKKEMKKFSPLKQVNESLCDGTAANTVFTFVDRERTAQENQTNPTETALAQLYAYIQCLPESSKKRKLIKQFNKENGYGTPLRTSGKKRNKALNLGDSIKKHLSGLSKTTKKTVQMETCGNDEEAPEPLYCTKKLYKDDAKVLNENNVLKQYSNKKSSSLCASHQEFLKESFKNPGGLKARGDEDVSQKFSQEVNASYESKNYVSRSSRASVPKKRSSTSPVKVSPRKTRRASDEFIAPVSGCELIKHHKWPVSSQDHKLSSSKTFFSSAQNLSYHDGELFKEKESLPVKDLYTTSRRAMSDNHLNEGFPEPEFGTQFKTPVHKNNFSRFTNTEPFVCSPNNTNRLSILYGPKNPFLMTTSTPATGNGCLLTPIVDKNNSMSPITKSTKRMPKAMQETMMTPRSRKPVISLSGTDLCNLANADSLEGNSPVSLCKMDNFQGKRLILEDLSAEGANDSLSSTFRNYLFSRSVLTASPVDLSFSSRTDDFLSLSDQNTSEENEDFKTLPEILNEAGLSESLLYCLDGNEPEFESQPNASEPKTSECSFSISNSKDNVHQVYETAL